MSVTRTSAGDLKKGGYVVINGEPCEVLSVSKSKPGKHGAAKVRIEARGLFDGARRSKIFPADTDVEVPIIEKRTGQILADIGDSVQVMDLETYETFEVPKTSIDKEIAGEISAGVEVEYWRALGRIKIVRVRGG